MVLHKKYSITILIALILIGLSLLVIKNKNRNISQIIQQKTTSLSQVYSNEIYGFQINYPDNYYIDSHPQKTSDPFFQTLIATINYKDAPVSWIEIRVEKNNFPNFEMYTDDEIKRFSAGDENFPEYLKLHYKKTIINGITAFLYTIPAEGAPKQEILEVPLKDSKVLKFIAYPPEEPDLVYGSLQFK